jgi:hypothetical protein
MVLVSLACDNRHASCDGSIPIGILQKGCYHPSTEHAIVRYLSTHSALVQGRKKNRRSDGPKLNPMFVSDVKEQVAIRSRLFPDSNRRMRANHTPFQPLMKAWLLRQPNLIDSAESRIHGPLDVGRLSRASKPQRGGSGVGHDSLRDGCKCWHGEPQSEPE